MTAAIIADGRISIQNIYFFLLLFVLMLCNIKT